MPKPLHILHKLTWTDSCCWFFVHRNRRCPWDFLVHVLVMFNISFFFWSMGSFFSFMAPQFPLLLPFFSLENLKSLFFVRWKYYLLQQKLICIMTTYQNYRNCCQIPPRTACLDETEPGIMGATELFPWSSDLTSAPSLLGTLSCFGPSAQQEESAQVC